MLSFPHLVVLFVVALVIFGPQKLPELARMLGKATAEFRKMTNDFRYALEDEVRELDRQTRIREEEAAAAARAAQAVPNPPALTLPTPTPPEGSIHRASAAPEASPEPLAEFPPHVDTEHPPVAAQEPALTTPSEKPSDDNAAV